MSLIQDADKIINKTKIKFDERWIQYILTAQSKFEMNICSSDMIHEMTDLIGHYTQLQERLREYIDTNQNYNVSGKSKKLNLSDYFAYGICMISNINDCKSFKDVLNKQDDFEITDISNSENYHEKDDDVMATYTNCMCSHSICAENSYVITNLKTRRSIMVGCHCIKKTDIINIEELKKLINKKNRKKQERAKRIKLTKQKKQEEEERLLNIIRKTELDKIKRRDLLIKWKGLIIKAVKHNNKIFWKNII